jgi:hypothetical protein
VNFFDNLLKLIHGVSSVYYYNLCFGMNYRNKVDKKKGEKNQKKKEKKGEKKLIN